MQNFIDRLPLLPTPDQMREWDRNAINFGIPEEILMENAGRAVAEFIGEHLGARTDKTIWLFMGSGNNGGDAACTARHLQDMGAKPVVFHNFPLEKMQGAAKFHLTLAQKDGVSFVKLDLPQFTDKHPGLFWDKILEFQKLPALLVDGLLGTGFTGGLRPDMLALISQINEFVKIVEVPVVAIDVPSGLNAENGKPQPFAVKCDFTVTLAAAKPGLLLPGADAWTGKIMVKTIGMPVTMPKPATYSLLDGTALLMPVSLPENSYKNIFGHLYVFGGKPGLEGAAHLSCAAALRTGVGLVTAGAPLHSLPGIKSGWPEIMTFPVSQGDEWPENLCDDLQKGILAADALVIGPGLGLGKDSLRFLEQVLSLPHRPPAIIDADALTLLAIQPGLLDFTGERDIFTPHPGEAARLLGITASTVQDDRMMALRRLVNIASGVFILKGAGTILSQRNEKTLLSPYDLPALAVGGSGDVLSGCAGAFLAMRNLQEDSTLAKAARAVISHAMAGLSLSEKMTGRGILANEIADELAHVREFILAKAMMVDKSGSYTPWPALP